MKTYLITIDIDKEKYLHDSENITDGVVFESLYMSRFTSANIADNDFFIADISNLKGVAIEHVHSMKHHIESRIKTGGVLVCFAGRSETYKTVNSNYSWMVNLSNSYSPENLSGKDFDFIEVNAAVRALKNFPGRFEYHQIFNQLMPSGYDVIAKNKAEKAVSLYYRLGDGHIFILPNPDNKGNLISYFVKNVLPALNVKFLISKGNNEIMPESLNGVSVVGESDLLAKIENQKSIIENEKSTLSTLEKEKDNLEEWKMLLWQTGDSLENVVRKFFELLGLELEKKKLIWLGNIKEKKFLLKLKVKTAV